MTNTTTITYTSLQSQSWGELLFSGIKKHLKQFSFFATICCSLLFSINSFGQKCDEHTTCRANDVRIRGAYLADENGEKISCTKGDPAKAFLYLRISSNAKRNGFYISADVVTADGSGGNTVVQHIGTCVSGELAKDALTVVKIEDPH